MPVYGETKKRKSRSKYPTWFHKLKVTELKELLSASKLPVSGSKDTLIQRLSNSENTKKYAMEARTLSRPTIHNMDRAWTSQSGHNINSLREECKGKLWILY